MDHDLRDSSNSDAGGNLFNYERDSMGMGDKDPSPLLKKKKSTPETKMFRAGPTKLKPIRVLSSEPS